MYKLSEHFSREEFACKCGCGFDRISPVLIERLELARGMAGVPFIVNCGCRCGPHNATVGGKPKSAHLQGEAVDLQATDNRSRFLILLGLYAAGFQRLELSKVHIHADVAEGAGYPRDVLILV
jgi:zinc D-Ala-D-Ala carboxypeptidase